jgi:AAA domain/MarR family
VGALVAFGSMTELDGRPKTAGKTTFLLAMIHAALDGSAFLGQATTRTAVVLLSEMPAASLRPALARHDLADREDLSILLWGDARGTPWPQAVAMAVDECARIGARLLVVDTLPQWAGLRGDAENDSGAALEAIAPLQAAAASGLAVVVARHDRKGGGEVGESARGSSAFTGAVDVVLQLRRIPNPPRPTIRQVVGLSRFDETPEDLMVELVDGTFVSLGSGEALAAAEARRTILELLEAGDPLTVAELCERGELKEQTSRETLASLVGAGLVVKSGAGKRGDPFRFASVQGSDSFARTLKGCVRQTNPDAPWPADPAELGAWVPDDPDDAA